MSFLYLVCILPAVLTAGNDHWHLNLKIKDLPITGMKSMPQKMYFEQKQDHFDLSNTNTWKQLYYVNDEYFKPGGPIFYYFNGEGPLVPQVVTELSFVAYAKKLGGMVISQEHRYYGTSFPVPNLETPNMKYLSSQQALADAAYMQQNITNGYPGAKNSKWLAVGGSYSGALVAWYRIKYPQLVVGAYSSSGVVHAEANYFGYWEIIEYALGFAKPANCKEQVAKDIDTMTTMLKTTSGQQALAKDFRLCANCSNLSSMDAQQNFLWDYATCAAADQYGGPDKFCGEVENGTDRFAAYAAACLGKETECNQINQWTQYDSTKTASVVGGRSWFWQKCTQFGWFKSSPASSMWPAAVTYPWLVSHCEKVFGIKNMVPDVDFTNLYYGGFSVPGTNILFIAGSYDPWNKVQITKPVPNAASTNRPNILINGTAHCADLEPPSPEDNASLKNARMRIEAWVIDLLDNNN